MQLKNHEITGIAFKEAFYTGSVITPEIVILHDTAGRLTKGNSADYLASKNTAQASVHFVIETDGTITQLVPTNRRANHAGRSSFHGRDGCNGFSIGIELVNPGRMTRSGNFGVAWYGQKFDIRLYSLVEMTTETHGHGVWMPYAEEQIEALLSLLKVLFRNIDTLCDITTHWYVSPGRKVDTNPTFPLREVRAHILGPQDPNDTAAIAGSESVPVNNLMVQINAGGDTLNMRQWPSFNPNVIAAIPDGTAVPVLRSGTFAGRDWTCVIYGGREGWIVSSYTTPLISSQI